MNLRMLQGAFIVLCFGYILAAIVLVFEIESIKPKRMITVKILRVCEAILTFLKLLVSALLRLLKILLIRIILY